MDTINSWKRRKIDCLTEQINEKAILLGWDDGTGDWEALSRFLSGTSTVLEQKRLERQDLASRLELLRLLKERSQLLRSMDGGEGYILSDNHGDNEPGTSHI